MGKGTFLRLFFFFSRMNSGVSVGRACVFQRSLGQTFHSLVELYSLIFNNLSVWLEKRINTTVQWPSEIILTLPWFSNHLWRHRYAATLENSLECQKNIKTRKEDAKGCQRLLITHLVGKPAPLATEMIKDL